MAEKKFTPFVVLQILKELSDENHILTTNELIEHVENRYNVHIERRTLYSNIEILEQAGYQISKYAENGKGYYLKKRQFDKGEVLLLCNAVHASHFISDSQSNRLINTLLKTLNKYDQKEYTDAVYMPNQQKTASDRLFDNIKQLSTAISHNKTISFIYMHYDNNKNLVPKRSERYEVEPRFIVYQDSRPYLIVTSKKHTDFTHYRIDKMSAIQIKNESGRRFMKENTLEAYQYAKNKLFMFAGEQIYVTLRCKNQVMDQMIDVFGTEMKILPSDAEHFVTRVYVNENGIILFAQQFMDALEIVDPPALRQKMKQQLSETLKRYQ